MEFEGCFVGGVADVGGSDVGGVVDAVGELVRWADGLEAFVAGVVAVQNTTVFSAGLRPVVFIVTT